MARNKVSKALTVEREKKIWALRLQGATYERIANETGISIAGVGKALTRMHKRYYQVHMDSVNQIKMEQINELMHIADEAYQAWERSKNAADAFGDPRFLQVLLKAKEDLRKLTGCEAALKADIRAQIVSNHNQPALIDNKHKLSAQQLLQKVMESCLPKKVEYTNNGE